MKKKALRTPLGYDGTKVTSRKLGDLLTNVLRELQETHEIRPDIILAAWPLIVGPQLAPMTQAISFSDGILKVKVNNSTLYSVLSQYNKTKLLNNLREKFPKVEIKDIFFRIG